MRRALPVGTADVAPAALVAALLVWISVDDAGYAITRWAPLGVAAVVLLAVRLVAAPPAWRALPRAVVVAVGALALYAVWSGLSIAWARDRGIAWEGADRTLLYLALFALLALWPLRPAQAGALTGAWAVAIGVFAAVSLVHAAAVPDPLRLFIDDRLLGPGGYVNASTALWLMAAWPAALLAAGRGTPWAARGVLAGAAVLLCDVALLSQSRGSVIAMPLTAIVCLVAFPGRVRLFGLLLVVAVGVAAAAPSLLDVGAAVRAGRSPGAELDRALLAALFSAAVVGAAVAAGARLVRARPPSALTARRAHAFGAAALAAGALAAVVVGLAVVGSPAAALSRGWDSFKGGYAEKGAANRLTTGLGSNRYDFYRVGLDAVRRRPLQGYGADNFRALYLRQGRSAETPAYPHSVEIRTLVSTGVIGALLLLAFTLAVAAGVVRGAAALRSPVGVAGVGAFAYWAIHGSADWLWEIAGLGGAAFAFAGVAMATLPRSGEGAGRAVPRPVAAIVAAVLGLGCVAALALPWLAQRDVDAAGRGFARDPGGAIAHLRRAAALDRLDAMPLTVQGAAWLRVGDVPRAQRAFEGAVERDRDNFYATLQLGAIASATGERARARVLVERARTLAPRDPVAKQVAAVVRAGRRVDLQALQAAQVSSGRSFRTG